MIIDDSSTDFLTEDIMLTNCSVIYDKKYPGRAELLPYYYFHILKPFDKAVIIHDSVFLQEKMIFNDEPVQFLWDFYKTWDIEIMGDIDRLIKGNHYDTLKQICDRDYIGCFGVMSVITWDFLHQLEKKHSLFLLLERVHERIHRCALERAFALMVTDMYPNVSSIYGPIHAHIQWGYTFFQYLQEKNQSIVKIWTGR
jgi:hypothetical protein